MKCFWDDRQRLHAPAGEFFNGAMHPAAEHPGRVDAILQAIGPTAAPEDAGLEPILRVHPVGYVEFLRTAHAQWRAAGLARQNSGSAAIHSAAGKLHDGRIARDVVSCPA